MVNTRVAGVSIKARSATPHHPRSNQINEYLDLAFSKMVSQNLKEKAVAVNRAMDIIILTMRMSN